jgi:ABC-2 type transport system permease protein
MRSDAAGGADPAVIRRIAAHEMTFLLRDGRFRWSAALVGALLLVSLGAGWVQYRTSRVEREVAAEATRAHWLGQEAKNPHSAAHFGLFAFKPRLPLSFVDQGVDPFAGTTVYLEPHRQNELILRPAQDASAAQRLGALTAAGVLQRLLPLLIILLAFASFAGEREQGTLRQVLALGVDPGDLAWGKALGLAGGLALLLLPAALLGGLALALGSAGAVAPTTGRVALLAAVYLAYFAVFIGISLAVSARAPSSRVALVGLLAFWMLNCLIVPRAAVDLSVWLYYTPQAVDFELSTVNEANRDFDARALELETLARYGVQRIEDLPVNYAGIELQAREEHAAEVFDRRYGELWGAFVRQAHVHELASVVAPMLAVRALSMGLAGTDLEQHRHFAQAAEGYRRSMVRVMNEDITLNSRRGEVYMAGPELWSKVPPFRYDAPGVRWALANRRISIAALGLWLVASALLATAAARRAPLD